MRHPEAKVVGSKKTKQMVKQYVTWDVDKFFIEIKGGACTGAHTLSFYMAPMVQPAGGYGVFEKTAGSLFSADAFGILSSRRQHFCRCLRL